MTTPTIVTYADRGAGFRPVEGVEAPAAYWAVAGRLRKWSIGQPPVPTGCHEIWSLQHVTASEIGEQWCFSVQGSGEQFGSAGTCQYVFAPTSAYRPGDLWVWCRDRIDENGLVDPGRGSSASRPGATAPAAAVHEIDAAVRGLDSVLGGRESGPRRVTIGGTPREVAEVIGRLLRWLSPEIVAAHDALWTTCLLARPHPADRLVLTGGWPVELRERSTSKAREIDRWLAARPDRGSRSAYAVAEPAAARAYARRERALGKLAELVASDRGTGGDGFPPTSTTWDGLLDDVAERYLGVEPADVAGLLETKNGRRILDTHPRALHDWARANPIGAIRFLMRRLGADDLQRCVLRALIEESLDRGGNVAHVPPAPEPPGLVGWHHRLAELLVRHVPERLDLMHQLRRPAEGGREAGPFADRSQLAHAADWLTMLGLDPQRHPEFFPTSVERITEHLRADSSGLREQDRRELERSANLFADLGQILPTVGTIPASLAHQLLDLAARSELAQPRTDTRGRLYAFAARLHQHSGPPQRRSAWLTELLDLLASSPTMIRAVIELPVVESGLSALPPPDEVAVPRRLLDRCARVLLTDPEQPAEVTVLLAGYVAIPGGRLVRFGRLRPEALQSSAWRRRVRRVPDAEPSSGRRRLLVALALFAVLMAVIAGVIWQRVSAVPADPGPGVPEPTVSGTAEPTLQPPE